MLKDVLRDVAEAIPKIEAEDARLDEEYGTKPEPGRAPAVDFWSPGVLAHNEAADELQRKLMTHDHLSLLKLEALLYYGRGDFDNFEEALGYMRGTDRDIDETVWTIMEKPMLLREYLDKARRRLEAQGRCMEAL